MNPDFWKNRTVLLTGHTGFKGSWLSLWLQTLGAKVVGYSLLPPTEPNLFTLAKVAQGMKSVIGDIRDFPSLNEIFQQEKPEIVFHLAAQALVRHSYDAPLETFSTNIMGTANLLEAVRKNPGVKVVVNVTSDKCYENKEWDWGYREIDPLGGHDPYSSSKACSELVTAAYRKSLFPSIATATARAGNVIGGGDWAQDRLIPDVMRAIIKGREVVIRNPGSIRSWQHVLEPLHGYLMLAEKLFENGDDFIGPWNFGPREGDAQPVLWIVQELSKLWGESLKWRCESINQVHEAGFLKLDISKARNHLQWKPKIDLNEALRLTVEWFNAFLANKDVRKVTEEQLLWFQELESI